MLELRASSSQLLRGGARWSDTVHYRKCSVTGEHRLLHAARCVSATMRFVPPPKRSDHLLACDLPAPSFEAPLIAAAAGRAQRSDELTPVQGLQRAQRRAALVQHR